MNDMSALVIDRASKSFGQGRVLDEISLSVAAGEFVTLLGASGCGKSTLLRAIAGLGSLDSGSILIGGRDVTTTPVHRRDIGMVFQSHALFPHMTVSRNVAFGLKMRGIASASQLARTEAALDLVRLKGFAGRYPHELSGGQQQRVAIARALVINPKILLLDEPFAALDRKLREEMQAELRSLTRRVGITTVFVTHDQEEALTLSDRIAVMNAGRIEQISDPDGVFSRPETAFVADFMGCRNILSAALTDIEGDRVRLLWDGTTLIGRAPPNYRISREKLTSIAVRPEYIYVAPSGEASGDVNAVTGLVESVIDQGAFLSLAVTVGAEARHRLFVRRPKSEQTARCIGVGDSVRLSWQVNDVVVLRDAPRANMASVQTY